MPFGTERLPGRHTPTDANAGSNGLRDRPKSLAQYVVDEIVVRIQNKNLHSGDKLPAEAAMMREFGVSRTVIREALSHLQAARLVETRHGIGTFVLPTEGLRSAFQNPQAPVNIRDIIAVIELRISLETEAVALASLRATPEQLAAMRDVLGDFARQVEQQKLATEADKAFHMAIARATGNRYFEEIFSYLGEIIPRARISTYRFSMESKADFLLRTYREHTTIFDAIVKNDPESARASMRVHLNSSRELMIKVLETMEDPASEYRALAGEDDSENQPLCGCP